MRLLSLEPHPDTPCDAVEAIRVLTRFRSDGALLLDYRIEGDMAALRIPDPAPPMRVDGLWRHTCLEAFVMAGEGPGYREFNLSPSGAWQAYDFRGYRDGGEPAAIALSSPLCDRSPHAFTLAVALPRTALPPGPLLRLGLSAVIEAADGRLGYWALLHPPGQPDFHYTGAFAFELAPPP